MDVSAQQGLERLELSCLDQLQHLPMILHGEAVQGRLDGKTGAKGLNPESDLAVGVADIGIAAQIDDRLMVLTIERAVAHIVPGIVGRLHILEERAHTLHQFGMVPLDGRGDSGDFKDFAQLADENDLIRGEAKDVGSALRQDLDQALQLKLQ